MASRAVASPPKPIAVIVQQGKVLDFIDGQTQREETPEEYVRQEIAKSLVREYGYPKKDISVEFTLRLGSRKPRADLSIFGAGDKSRLAAIADRNYCDIPRNWKNHFNFGP